MKVVPTRHSGNAMLVALVFVQLILLGYQIHTNRDIPLLRYWVVSAMVPVKTGLQGIGGTVAGSWNRYVWFVDRSEKNREIEAEATRLYLENQWLRQSLRRVSRETELGAYQRESALKTVLARVIAGGSNPLTKELFLNRGNKYGIRSGMAVITADGIVGRVQASYADVCLVLLVNDKESGAGIVLADSRVQGVLKGTGGQVCKIDYILPETNVSPGELVYTSGNDRVFPRGLLVGRVTRVSKGAPFQDISVELSAPPDLLEQALIVTAGVRSDLPSGAEPASSEVLTAAGSIRGRQLENAEAAPPSGPLSATVRREALVATIDADRIKQRYREIVGAQGAEVGNAGPAVPPPDFNFDPDAQPLVEPAPEDSESVSEGREENRR